MLGLTCNVKMTIICNAAMPVHKNIWHVNREGWVGFGKREIVLNVVIGDKTDTDVELVVIIQNEQGHNRIKLRKNMKFKLHMK